MVRKLLEDAALTNRHWRIDIGESTQAIVIATIAIHYLGAH
jgi:hypothetical protein